MLDPNTRIAELLFGLIMVLTFTGSLSVADSGREDVRLMLIGALGCNLAWGLIDGLFYLMGTLAERGEGLRALRSVRQAATPADAHRVISDAIPPIVADAFEERDYEALRRKMLEMPEPPTRTRLDREDWVGAAAVFLWVFITTFPVAIPFIVMDELGPAMRVSNGIAVAMLFVAGYAFAHVANYRPILTGILMVLLGSAVVAGTIALGG